MLEMINGIMIVVVKFVTKFKQAQITFQPYLIKEITGKHYEEKSSHYPLIVKDLN